MAEGVRDSALKNLLSSCFFPIYFWEAYKQFLPQASVRPQPHLKRDLIEVLFNKSPEFVASVVVGTLFCGWAVAVWAWLGDRMIIRLSI